MKLADVTTLLEYMNSTYLKKWYNHTLPFKFGKVAEQNEHIRLSEKMVQAIWNDHKFLQGKLVDDQNCSLEIIFNGNWNREPGPDFKNAVIAVNGKKCHGDVEVHLSPSHWKAHGHHLDPLYKNVILHVVWKMQNHKFPPNIPHLELSSQLTLPEERVLELTELNNYSKAKMHPAAECSDYINQIQDHSLQMVFRAAGLSRLHRKSLRFGQDIAEMGLAQAFYLSLAEAHGYKNNRPGFKKLATIASLDALNKFHSAMEKEAFIWGCSGLLPDISQHKVHPELKDKTVALWNTWWKLRTKSSYEVQWSQAPQRPLNSPERRIAALLALLTQQDFQPEKILWQALSLISDHSALKRYLDSLFDFDSEWQLFCNFRTKIKKKSRLVGTARKMDIIINIIVPAMIALIDPKDVDKLNSLYHFYCKLPKSQHNHTLDIAAHKFFIPPHRAKEVIKKSVEQQGLIQLMQDFQSPSQPCEVVSFWEEFGISISSNKN